MTDYIDDGMSLPNPTERIKLKGMLVEMTKLMQQNDDNRAAMKDIAAGAEEAFGIKKKFVGKLAKTMYKHNYADLQAENEHFELLYENLIEGKKPTTPAKAADDDEE
jgi:hypothetical protein